MASMQKIDQERFYWFTVQDTSELFVHNNINVETFLGDVLDSVLRVRPECRQAFQILRILDQISQLKDIDDANDIAIEVFKA
jgi:hypothetical protein